MTQEGYVSLHRCLLDSSWAKQPDFVTVWIFCLLSASYKERVFVTKGGLKIKLLPGDFVTSRESISKATGVQESKVERVLKTFKSEQQIEQQNRGIFRVISITNWNKYQVNEQQNEQHLNNKRTTIEQHLNTNNKVKKEKKETIGRESDGLFNQFWAAYPKKTGKGAAEKSFDKIKPSKDLADQMVEAINQQAGSEAWRKDAGQYIPNPATWLNQKRWEDEPIRITPRAREVSL